MRPSPKSTETPPPPPLPSSEWQSRCEASCRVLQYWHGHCIRTHNMYIALSGCLHLKLGCMTANILKDRQFQESKINGRRIRFCGQVFECHLETTCLNACILSDMRRVAADIWSPGGRSEGGKWWRWRRPSWRFPSPEIHRLTWERAKYKEWMGIKLWRPYRSLSWFIFSRATATSATPPWPPAHRRCRVRGAAWSPGAPPPAARWPPGHITGHKCCHQWAVISGGVIREKFTIFGGGLVKSIQTLSHFNNNFLDSSNDQWLSTKSVISSHYCFASPGLSVIWNFRFSWRRNTWAWGSSSSP